MGHFCLTSFVILNKITFKVPFQYCFLNDNGNKHIRFYNEIDVGLFHKNKNSSFSLNHNFIFSRVLTFESCLFFFKLILIKNLSMSIFQFTYLFYNFSNLFFYVLFSI